MYTNRRGMLSERDVKAPAACQTIIASQSSRSLDWTCAPETLPCESKYDQGPTLNQHPVELTFHSHPSIRFETRNDISRIPIPRRPPQVHRVSVRNLFCFLVSVRPVRAHHNGTCLSPTTPSLSIRPPPFPQTTHSSLFTECLYVQNRSQVIVCVCACVCECELRKRIPTTPCGEPPNSQARGQAQNPKRRPSSPPPLFPCNATSPYRLPYGKRWSIAPFF